MSNNGKIIAALLGSLVFIGLLCWLFIPHETVAKITYISWRYRVDLRQRTLRHDSGWGSPFGSFNVSCYRKYYGQEDCNPHRCYSSLATGDYRTCYDRCSVYKDWCEYDYYDWPIIKTEETSGIRHNEYWPSLAAVGDEQRLDCAERYEVKFVGDTDWTYAASNLGDFHRFQVNEIWKIKVNKVKMVTPLQLLHAEAELP